MPITHAFTSAKSDGGDATLVRPSNWNADHLGSDIENRSLAQVDVANTTTETSLYSRSLAAALLGSDGGIRLSLSGDTLVNVAGTLTLRVKLGATTVFTTSSLDFADSATRRNWKMDVEFMNSATNAQQWAALFHVANATTGFPISLTDVRFGVGLGTSAEDTTGALTFTITAQWTVASANLSFRAEMAILELLPKS